MYFPVLLQTRLPRKGALAEKFAEFLFWFSKIGDPFPARRECKNTGEDLAAYVKIQWEHSCTTQKVESS